MRHVDDRRHVLVRMEDVIRPADEDRGHATPHEGRLVAAAATDRLARDAELRRGVTNALLQLGRLARDDERAAAAADHVEVDHRDEALHASWPHRRLRRVRLWSEEALFLAGQ